MLHIGYNMCKPGLRMERTFHPIGQGAFYTEVFTDDYETKFVMVYDCGTESSNDDMEIPFDEQIDSFKKSLGPRKHIDLLFISHFHKDHINGLDKLLTDVSVGKTIIPMLPQSIITLTRVHNFLMYKNDAYALDRVIMELYNGINDERDGRFGEVQVVMPDNPDERLEGDNNRWVGNGKRIKKGELIPFKNHWIYEPFNSIEANDPRAIAFMKELVLIKGAMRNNELDVNHLIRGCRKEVMTLYKKVMKKQNDNLYTLVVESRPAKDVAPLPGIYWSRCLYMGDLDSKNNDDLWNRLYKTFDYNNIGCIQVPHHGARDNWRDEMMKVKTTDYIISAGRKNTYHHPDYWLVENLKESNHCVFVISEKNSPGYQEEIWGI